MGSARRWQEIKKIKNHGKILVYTSTTPPTMPAPNNRLELKSKTARDENRNTMTPTQEYAGLITLVLMVQPLRELGGAIKNNKYRDGRGYRGKGTSNSKMTLTRQYNFR